VLLVTGHLYSLILIIYLQ